MPCKKSRLATMNLLNKERHVLGLAILNLSYEELDIDRAINQVEGVRDRLVKFREPTKLDCAEAIKAIIRLEEKTDNAIVRDVLQDTRNQLHIRIAHVALEETK